MSRPNWEEIERAVGAVLELPEEERAAYLARQPQGIREEVESLLAAYRRSGGFLGDETSKQTSSPDLPGKMGAMLARLAAAARVPGALEGSASFWPADETLMTGRQLGQYQIVEKLGQGGMGVVYKARDTRLNRYVALKVLPADRIADPDRKRRFMHEARAASALNHPNIITVHDIAQEAGVDFIVMEYLAGKTLETVIRRKGMPIGEALRCGVQMADALATAHRAGIVHRDLKPANVMVSDSGLVKVLDFGLAKLSERPATDGHDETRTAVTGEPITDKGTILGTVNYMSPEQAQGKAVDARSDIFSFGAVLYEMVTGRRAVQGETTIDTLSAIMRDEPKPASELRSGLPHEIDRTIARCLRKEPGRRFQHMEDLKVALEELREESDRGKVATAHPARPRRMWLPISAAGVVALVTFAAVAWWYSQSRREVAPMEPVLTRLTSDSGLSTEPALSPDGKLVAYASDRAGEGSLDIWIQQIAGGEVRRLTTDPADDREPHFSPDGSRIVFSSEREAGGLYVVSTVGGMERKIAGRGYRPRFSPDGSQIAYWVGERGGGGFTPAASTPFEVRIVPAEGGPTRKVQGNLPGAWLPVWSPDSSRLLMEGLAPGADLPLQQRLDWWIVEVNTGLTIKTGGLDVFRAHKLFVESGLLADTIRPLPESWSGNGVFFSARLGDTVNIWEIMLSSRDLKVSGSPRRVTSGSAAELYPSLWQGPDSTRLAFAGHSSNVNIWSFPFDTNSPESSREARQLTDSLADDVRPSITADGQTLFYNSNRSGNWDVWRMDVSNRQESPLASSAANETGPRISPDGRDIIYTVHESNRDAVYLMPATGGLSRKVADDCTAFPWAHLSRSFLCWNNDGIWLVNVESGRRNLITPRRTAGACLSWDDQWMACYRAAEQPGRSRVFAVPMREAGPTPENEWVAVTSGEFSDAIPEFSPDGRVLYFMSLRDGFACLWAQRLDPATKKPKDLPFAVQHFHSARRSLGARPGHRAISIARNMLVATMEERTGNIWMVEQPR
jgi:serine/threonine protein kinase/Tol biopolymer transport system component